MLQRPLLVLRQRPGLALQNKGMTSYWRRNLAWIAVELSLWFSVTFVVAYFARDLAFEVGGWPLSFWIAAQGAPLVYLLIVWVYGLQMNRHEHQMTPEVDSGANH